MLDLLTRGGNAPVSLACATTPHVPLNASTRGVGRQTQLNIPHDALDERIVDPADLCLGGTPRPSVGGVTRQEQIILDTVVI